MMKSIGIKELGAEISPFSLGRSDDVSVKQDRSVARTAVDLERKYNFGKTFAEIIGLIDDSRDKVDSVESSLRNEITQQSTTLSRSVSEISAKADSLTKSVSELDDTVTELSSSVEMKLDSEAVSIIVEQELANGTTRVETETGFVFDSNGMNISKSGEEMSSLVDNTGIYVAKNGEEILTANGDGVKATDLHAKTYLIIGAGDGRSRFEDYGINRTACFWVGG